MLGLSRTARATRAIAFTQTVRFLSTQQPTISTLYAQLNASPNQSQPQELSNLKQIVANSDLSTQENELESLHNLVKLPHVEPGVINELLTHGLPHDFSLYYSVTKRASQPDHAWTAASLTALIENNPGRVFSGWDLLNQYSNESNVSDSVYRVVIDKLLTGERAEIKNNEFELGVENLSRALSLLPKFSGVNVESESAFKVVLDAMSKLNLVSAVELIESEPFIQWFSSKGLATLSGRQLLTGFDKVFDLLIGSGLQISKELLCSVIRTGFSVQQSLDKLNQEDAEEKKQFEQLVQLRNQDSVEYRHFAQPETTKLIDDVLKYIDAAKLDVDQSPESLLIRLELIGTYGMDLNNIEQALAKFHHYQTHEKFGIELVQAKLAQSFIYQAVVSGKPTMFTVAETLNLEHIPIPILQCFILGYGTHDVDKSLQLYNDFIQRVSKKLNPVTKRSPAGLLTESLMMAYLVNHDREFAYLLFDKAAENGIISDELEVATIKKVFKVYGDAYADDDRDKADQFLRQYVIRAIRQL